MKSLTQKFLIALVFSVVSLQAFAQNEGKGGGDVACEDRIKVIQQDIKTWIKNGGHDALRLPKNISHEQYKQRMLEVISKVKFHCVSEGDKDFPVQVYGIPKVCAFDKNSNSFVCDFRKFAVTDQSDQYVQIHHEDAGLAGIELPNKADSDYSTSNQISEYLVEVTIKKLAVKLPHSKIEYPTPDKIICTTQSTWPGAESFEIKNLDSESPVISINDAKFRGLTMAGYLMHYNFSNQCDNDYDLVFQIYDFMDLKNAAVPKVYGLLTYINPELTELNGINDKTETVPVICTRK